jgi:acyl dehydratase
MSGLDELIGRSYGPFPLAVTDDRVAAFASAIGDDGTDGQASPMFANVALFAAAPALLDDEAVRPFTRSLIHSEQSFSWLRPLAIGEELGVVGTVQGVRARGPLHLVTFSLEAESDRGPWLTGSSVFLMSDQAAAAAAETDEPAVDERPPSDIDGGSLQLPAEGEQLVDLRCGASRSDLMRYAAASEDWNPIHFDHDSARAAGLGGVIVHGLLMAAWMGRLAGRYGVLDSIRARFRNPLHPAVAARVTGVVGSVTADAAELDLVLLADDQRLVTASALVTQ